MIIFLDKLGETAAGIAIGFVALVGCRVLEGLLSSFPGSQVDRVRSFAFPKVSGVQNTVRIL